MAARSKNLNGQRRCIAVDLPLHGKTPAAADQDFLYAAGPWPASSPTSRDALELTEVDLVANDTGGAVSQGTAVNTTPSGYHADPDQPRGTRQRAAYKALLPGVCSPAWACTRASRPASRATSRTPRKRIFGLTYQDVTRLPEDIVRAWVEPQVGTAEAARQSYVAC